MPPESGRRLRIMAVALGNERRQEISPTLCAVCQINPSRITGLRTGEGDRRKSNCSRRQAADRQNLRADSTTRGAASEAASLRAGHRCEGEHAQPPELPDKHRCLESDGKPA